jgi:acetyltransferase EpsM
MAIPVIIPLINPNEPEALLADIRVQEGQQVSQGELIASLETTKTSAEVFAEADGFIAGLHHQAGDHLRAGEVLCYLSPDPDWKPAEKALGAPAQAEGSLPEGLRITDPALSLARQHGIDLTTLPLDVLVTETVVREKAAAVSGKANFHPPTASFDPTALVIYGGGGHAKMVIDLLRALGTYRVVGILDDARSSGELISGIPVIGGGERLKDIRAEGVRLAVNAVGGIGNIQIRIKIFHRLSEAGLACPALVHPTAYLDPSVVLDPGAQVFVHGYIGPDARIGYGCIINTRAIVSHDCILGDYVNISPGAILAGEVKVGSGALIGMGATINLGVQIGSGASVGNSATVKADVPEGGIVRAGTIWPV